MYPDDNTLTDMLVRAGIPFKYSKTEGAGKTITVFDDNDSPVARFQFSANNTNSVDQYGEHPNYGLVKVEKI